MCFSSSTSAPHFVDTSRQNIIMPFHAFGASALMPDVQVTSHCNRTKMSEKSTYLLGRKGLTPRRSQNSRGIKFTLFDLRPSATPHLQVEHCEPRIPAACRYRAPPSTALIVCSSAGTRVGYPAACVAVLSRAVAAKVRLQERGSRVASELAGRPRACVAAPGNR